MKKTDWNTGEMTEWPMPEDTKKRQQDNKEKSKNYRPIHGGYPFPEEN